MSVEPASVLVPGPWTHRDVSTNGTRLHIAEIGTGPLVLLVHGFPEFWWSWRHQLTALAQAGYRAVACDLRGYGASDKPPRGYDIFTLCADLAGLIGALGERQAVLVGHDCGGFLAWATAVLHPGAVARLVVSGAPHPLRMRQAIFSEMPGQLKASSYVLGFQVPWKPERELVRNDAALVGELLRRWSGHGFPDPETDARDRQAMQIPGVAHSSMEYYRWVFRSMFRPDGWRMIHSLREAITVPTLQLHGLLDTCVLADTAKGSGEYVAAPYEWRPLSGVGHFAHQEAPEAFNVGLLDWLGVSPPERDRDPAGRPRSARRRDALGRPLTAGLAGSASRDPELTSLEAADPLTLLAGAQRLLDEGRPFEAHEVLEAGWKRAPDGERALWRALAQLAVGVTHHLRGNPAGAKALFSRAAETLESCDGPSVPYGIDAGGLAGSARRFASGEIPGRLRLTHVSPVAETD